MDALSARTPAEAPAGGTTADLSLLRRADAAGQRLFRELVVSRIAWQTVSEASRLIAVDVVGVSLPVTGCTHTQPCTLHHCFDRLRMKAVLGNRGPALPGLRFGPGVGVGGIVLATGAPLSVSDYRRDVDDPQLVEIVVGEEGIRSVLGVPISFGGEVRGVLHAGLRRRGGFSAGAIEALERLCTYSGAALAAARDRARVEEVAALRERRRLARALHDDLGHRMFGIGMAARLARESAAAGRPDLLGHLSGVEREVAAAASALKTTLRTLDTPQAPAGALAVKLREALAEFSDRCGVPAHLVVLGEPVPLDGVQEDLLSRVGQEALHNVERHAGAFEVITTLAFEADRVELVVQDDGVGPSDGWHRPPSVGNGVGLGMLREEVGRLGGELSLARNEDAGSTLRTCLPRR